MRLMDELEKNIGHQAARGGFLRTIRKDKDKEDILSFSKRLDEVIVQFGVSTSVD